MHARQWVGTFGGKGTGAYRGELATAPHGVGTSLQAWDLPPDAGIIRVDGQYRAIGGAAVIAHIVQSGLQVIVRGRGSTLLEHPLGQAVLTQTGPVTITMPESHGTYEVCDIPSLPLGQPRVARRAARSGHPHPSRLHGRAHRG
jgi:hypothetical protein